MTTKINKCFHFQSLIVCWVQDVCAECLTHSHVHALAFIIKCVISVCDKHKIIFEKDKNSLYLYCRQSEAGDESEWRREQALFHQPEAQHAV